MCKRIYALPLVWLNPADLAFWDHHMVQSDTKSCCCCGQECKCVFTRDTIGLSHRKWVFWEEWMEMRSVCAGGNFCGGGAAGGISRCGLVFGLILSYQDLETSIIKITIAFQCPDVYTDLEGVGMSVFLNREDMHVVLACVLSRHWWLIM